jgi:dTDP-glucose 4,6-dehydratase
LRYLILGSNSCAGSHWVKHLLNNGHDVIATSRSEEAPQQFLAYEKGRANFERVDINSDINALEKIVRHFKPHVVGNFSSQSMVAESWQYPEHWIQTNISSTLRVFSLFSTLSGLERFVHFSTPEVYGNCVGRIPETAAINPSTPYAVTRASGDFFGRIWGKQYSLPIVITRAGNVYGEGQKLYRIIPRSIHYCHVGKRITLDGGGITRRNFVYGGDVASALDVVVEKGAISECYHISSPEYVSIRDLVQAVVLKCGGDFSSSVTFGAERPGKDLDYSLGDEKLRGLGWSNVVSLDAGIDRVIGWYSEHNDRFSPNDEVYNHRA